MLNTLQPLTNSLKNTNFVKRNSKYTLSKDCYLFLTIKIYITWYYLHKYKLVFLQKHFCDPPLDISEKEYQSLVQSGSISHFRRCFLESLP